MSSHEDTVNDIRRETSKWLTEYLTSEEWAGRPATTFDQAVQASAEAVHAQQAVLGITPYLEELGGTIAQMSALREITRGVLAMLELASESA